MVCGRCITAVGDILQKEGISYSDLRLGEVDTNGELSPAQRSELQVQLQMAGFELLEATEDQLINRIKASLVKHLESGSEKNISETLVHNLHRDYSYLSKLFSQVEGRSIENYYILLRLEKAKELISYNQLSLTEIAYQLNYSNVAHLSAQFKRHTGLTPTQFKALGRRRNLDEV